MTADFVRDLVITLASVFAATVGVLVLAEIGHTQRNNRRKP